MTESNADARGPASRSAQGAADKTRIVLSLPHQDTPTDPPIMARAGASLKATRYAGGLWPALTEAPPSVHAKACRLQRNAAHVSPEEYHA
ncbi:hypothetical protein D1O30_16440 [Methylocystis hirsuta]|uniref:Uncharacterized protein n=1 Tax=Methylocystis hirsuta TaxID=369798 RepID=A0A3M9XSV3_9HYPH|nr:hypothetical protein D1O30_16440 [Methylocystis hirsuta]